MVILRPRILHLAAAQVDPRAWTDAFRAAVGQVGELEIVEEGTRYTEEKAAERIRQYDILVTSWGSRPVPATLAADPGRLRYICHLTGQMRDTIPLDLIEAPLPVTNWGDAQARAVAEGAVTLLLACLKGLRPRIEHIAAGGWHPADDFHSGMLQDLDLGLYGCGFIGCCFVEMVHSFGPRLRVYDPHAGALPSVCERVHTLEALFESSRAVAIHAGLSPETEGTVTAQLLAHLPDGGILINTARGAIVDQEALFAEVESGRLRAGLDVLAPPEKLPADHPARGWPNLILSAHSLSQPFPKEYGAATAFEPMHHICLNNLRRFVSGKPLRFLMDRQRYEIST